MHLIITDCTKIQICKIAKSSTWMLSFVGLSEYITISSSSHIFEKIKYLCKYDM